MWHLEGLQTVSLSPHHLTLWSAKLDKGTCVTQVPCDNLAWCPQLP